MRRGSGCLRAKPCVGFAIVSNKDIKRGAHRKIAARFDYSAFFSSAFFSSSTAGSSPSASSGVTTAAVSGGFGSKAQISI